MVVVRPVAPSPGHAAAAFVQICHKGPIAPERAEVLGGDELLRSLKG